MDLNPGTQKQVENTPVARTPHLTFRPRKFSSPFLTFPALHLHEDVKDAADNDRLSLVDSGLGLSLPDHVTERTKLCPKYHNEGICELGPKCPMTHEEKPRHVTMTSFDPDAPEFIPARLRHKKEAEDSVQAQTTRHSGVCALTREPDSLTGHDCGDYDLLTEIGFFGGGVNSFDAVSTATEEASRANPSCMKRKTEPCTTFHTIGSCPYGDRCLFYHGEGERSDARCRVKTRLCKSWTASGSCGYGRRCDFAHGSEELNVKFKTRMCKVFVSTGRCPYGEQCTFAHSEVEKRDDISTIYKFKTEMCQLWLRGNCSFGPVCHFAHGVHELNTNPDVTF